MLEPPIKTRKFRVDGLISESIADGRRGDVLSTAPHISAVLASSSTAYG